MKKFSAKVGLFISVLTLLATFWAYAAEFTRLQETLKIKADKTEVINIHNKLDIIICYLDKNKCL